MINREKFKNKYRIESTRLKGWDYSTPGLYFITICTKDMADFFCEIKNDQMQLNPIGKIADQNWKDIPKHFNNVRLDKFVIMPNHVHGILEIVARNENDDDVNVNVHVETLHATSLRDKHFSQISPKSKSIPTIIRSYKSACTKMINQFYPDLNFAWQSRFYDVIIRDNKSLANIRNYIINNPVESLHATTLRVRHAMTQSGMHAPSTIQSKIYE